MSTLKTKLLRILFAVVLAVSLAPCTDLLGALTDEQRNRLNQIKQQYSALGDLIDKTLNPRARTFADVGAKLASMTPEQIRTFAESDQNLYQSAHQAINYLEALSTQTPARTNVAQSSNNQPQLQQLDPLLNENNSSESTDNGAAQGSENHSSFQDQEDREQQQIEDQQQQQLQQQPDDIAVSSNSDDGNSNRPQQLQIQNQENGFGMSSHDQSESTSAGSEEEEEEEYSDSDENAASHHEEEEEGASDENDSSDSANGPQRRTAGQQQQQGQRQPQQNQPRHAVTFQAPLPIQQQLQQQQTLSAAMNNAASNGPLPEYRNDIFEQASVLRQNANVLQDVARHVSMTDNRRVVLNAGYLNHKQSVARGLGYNADTFMITGVVNGFVVDTPNGGTCSLALAAAYADTSAKYKGKCSKSGNKFKEKTFLVGPCITYKSGMLEVDASLLYGHTKYNALRSFSLANHLVDARNTSYKGDSLHGQLMVSYAIPCSSFIVQPQIGIAYDHITQKGHKFRSGNAALDVKKQKLDFLTVFTGVRVSTDTLMNGRLKPYVFVGFAQDVHRHADVAKKVNASYGQVSTSINAVSYPGKRGHLMTSAGVEFMATDAISVDVSYHGNFNGHRKTHAALCEVGYNF